MTKRGTGFLYYRIYMLVEVCDNWKASILKSEAWNERVITFTIFLGTAEIQDGKISQTHQSNGSLQYTDANFGKSFKDFPAALKVK